MQGLERVTSRTDSEGARRPVSNRTRNNSRLCVQTLFSFARAQRYLGLDWNEMDAVPLWKVKDEEIEIFTPDEMTLLLALVWR